MLTKEELSNMSIFELRAKAREMGVKAPTTKRHCDLVEDILKVQNGEIQPVKTRMGRPPKKSSVGINSELLKTLKETSLVKNEYHEVNFQQEDKVCFKDGQKVNCLNEDAIFNAYGVVREHKGTYYIQNFSFGCRYILITIMQRNEFNLELGDLIYCTAKISADGFGELCEVKSKNFDDKPVVESLNLTKAEIRKCKTNADMYKTILAEECGNKIVLELESNLSAYNTFDNNVVFVNSVECDDVVLSYNILLDCKNLVSKLCKAEQSFTLYMVDIDYTYEILNIYYTSITDKNIINAGQYFKEIINMVVNSKNGRIVLLHKENSKRSSYLDNILNKYC